MTDEAVAFTPSWLRWPPNCCETCVAWRKEGEHVGRCESPVSTHIATDTDSRFRCPDFYRMTEQERKDNGGT